MRAGDRAHDRWCIAARSAALILAVAACLSGCGQTGPLYLPDDGSTTVITRPGPATTGNQTPAPPASSEAGAVPDAVPDATPAAPASRPPAKR